MNKITKNILLIGFILILILVAILTNKSKNNSRFYLTEKYYNNGSIIKMNSEELSNISNDSFILFTYNSFCGFSKPCEEVFDAVLKRNKIDYITISIDEFKKTKYHETVLFAPSVLIIKDGEIVDYLDAENDNHLKYYQEERDFENWLSGRIYFEKKQV